MMGMSLGQSSEKGSLLGDFSRQLPRLTPDQEQQFQAEYYARILPTLRLVSLLLAGLVAAQALVQSRTPALSDLAVGVPALAFWLCVFGLTWVQGFSRVWQPALVLLGWVAAVFVLGGLGHTLGRLAVTTSGAVHPPTIAPQQKFFFVLQMAVFMVTLSTLRLPYRWGALIQGGVIVIGVFSFVTNLPTDALRDLHFLLLPTLLLLLALLLGAFTQEQLARVAFWNGHLLAEERDVERRQREQTEGQLRVLARAIGGIVHDLGNPLTVVQMGADILGMQYSASEVAAIQEAAKMLAALRLSLIEQTRVLEGKPIPVDLRPESLRSIVEMGSRFQNSRLMYGRSVSLIGEKVTVHADNLKLVTVFMNLIGNALKYSDGDVRIAWRTEGNIVLVGVLDQGTAGVGISEAQARRLFVAFGRLETHAQVEGTGLGLVSARKIVEAHGGEAFIEGASGFTTAVGKYPSLLTPGFRTGFVIALPCDTES